MSAIAEVDPLRRPPRAAAPPGCCATFNDAGVLAAADVHVALRLARLGRRATTSGRCWPPRSPCAAPRLGPRLRRPRDDPRDRDGRRRRAGRPLRAAWPDPTAWVARLRGERARRGRRGRRRRAGPLRLVGTALYLDRYWREERQVAADLRALAAAPPGDVDETLLADGLARLFPARADERQRARRGGRRAAPLRGRRRRARAPARRRRSRGSSRCSPSRPRRRRAAPLVALAAPTGKAAARLEEAVHEEAARPRRQRRASARSCSALQASTLHRLLGWRPGSHSRFRHDRGNRLPHDVVIVDETSMVSLSLMARLVEAVRPEARLVLVGDPGQLTSIEAGAVLGDIVGPPPTAAHGASVRGSTRRATATGGGRSATARADASIRRRGIADADASRRCDATRRRRQRDRGSTWIDADADDALAPGPRRRRRRRPRRDRRRPRRRRRAALAALGAFRVLCAHRRGALRRGDLDDADRGAGSRARSTASAPRAHGTPAARCS